MCDGKEAQVAIRVGRLECRKLEVCRFLHHVSGLSSATESQRESRAVHCAAPPTSPAKEYSTYVSSSWTILNQFPQARKFGCVPPNVVCPANRVASRRCSATKCQQSSRPTSSGDNGPLRFWGSSELRGPVKGPGPSVSGSLFCQTANDMG